MSTTTIFIGFFFIFNIPVLLYLLLHWVSQISYILGLTITSSVLDKIITTVELNSFIRFTSLYGWVYSFVIIISSFFLSIFALLLVSFGSINPSFEEVSDSERLELFNLLTSNFSERLEFLVVSFVCLLFSFLMCMIVWVKLMVKNNGQIDD